MESTRGLFHWPAVKSGQKAILSCPFGNENQSLLPAVRSCQTSPNKTVAWNQPDISMCREASKVDGVLVSLETLWNNVSIFNKSVLERTVDQIDQLVSHAVMMDRDVRIQIEMKFEIYDIFQVCEKKKISFFQKFFFFYVKVRFIA